MGGRERFTFSFIKTPASRKSYRQKNTICMKSAYLYVRVSTDEQKRQGYSLIEQEERLLQYCEINDIQVDGTFREDHSAKDFNRPEWKRLIKTIKKDKARPPGNILFLKWDRFSRSIQYAYQMIGILKALNIRVSAIDQKLDLEVPESIVMLAIYLSIPEAENSRRGKNTSDGMRRARKLGRYPGKAPIGYKNLTNSDGKKFIAPKQPEANHIKWSFQQIAIGAYSLTHVRKMACLNGFQCSRKNFWRVLRNPVYCGIVTLSANKDEEKLLIKGIHEPLISEELFQDVQSLLNNRARPTEKKEKLKHLFPLRGCLICPYCHRRLTGSTSCGRNAKYRYYHCCTPICKGRFRADSIEAKYEEQLENISIKPEALKLFKLVLEDENVFTARKVLFEERDIIHNEVSKEQLFLSRAVRLLVDEKIDFDDLNHLKQEHKEKLNCLNDRLTEVNGKIKQNQINIDNESAYINRSILFSYKNQDIATKRSVINLFLPSSIDLNTGNLNPLKVSAALEKIIVYKQNLLAI
jgi:site-specific DNA recombinase